MGTISVEAALEALKAAGKPHVPESDLLAAKKGLEGSLARTQTDLANVRVELDSKHQEVLDVQAALKEAEGKLSGAGKSAEEVKGLKQQLVEATKSREEAVNRILGLRRMAILAKVPKMDKAKLEAMTPEQLDALEGTLEYIPGEKPGWTPDGGSGGGGGVGPKGGRANIVAGLAARDQ